MVEYQYNHAGGRVSAKPTTITGFGSTRSFVYDELMRLEWSQLLTPEGASVEKEFEYDEFDRVLTNRYGAPLDMRVDHEYTSTGHLAKVYDSEENVTYFRAASMDGLGRYTEYSLVDGHNSLAAFNGPFPILYRTPNIQHLEMEWDPITGNLSNRYDGMISRKELFAYDNLDRLIQTRLYETDGAGSLGQGLGHTDYMYDAVLGITKGNLVVKDDVGRMGYTGHRVANVVHNAFPVPPDMPPAVISIETQAISYTSYHQPYKITERVGNVDYELDYTYGPGHQRVFGELIDQGNGPVETRLYDGDYERQYDAATGTTYHIVYVAGGNGLCAMVLQRGTNTEQMYRYAVYKDHLGSILALSHTTGMLTGIVAEQSFDAWGRPRNPGTWQFENLPVQPTWLYRGYTGHEHVAPFALINMNGRMYDPVNGRMLGADNHVAGAHSTQGFNRYSYVNNNPLAYTDPSGELAWFIPVIVGAAVGTAVGGASHAGDYNFLQWSSDSWKAAAIGGMVGAGLGYATSFGLAAGGANIKGISAQGYTGAAGLPGAHTASWNVVSNGLITANINLISASLQGRDLTGVYQSGLAGLASGSIGGLFGHLANPTKNFSMSTKAVRVQNYVTAGLNGFFDRLSIAHARGDRGSSLWRNSLKGMGEGLLAANLVNNNYFYGTGLIETGASANSATTLGQHLSSAVTQAVTSVPGAGYSLYSYYTAALTGYTLGHRRVLGGVGYGIAFVLHPAPIAVTNWWMGDDYPALMRPYTLWDLFGVDN
ncbi:MAG: hypothetical protein IPL52_11720 [Flavobacteriales bacterium]|nr:hypothetical protein [Flavobacteriales bacterium]